MHVVRQVPQYTGRVNNMSTTAVKMSGAHLSLLLLCVACVSAFPNARVGDLEPWRQDPETAADMFEGDIKLDVGEDPEDARNAVHSWKRWPNGVIPYEFVAEYTDDQKKKVQKAFDEYEKKTCLRFVPRTNEGNWIGIIKDRDMCYSSVGKGHGRQGMSLENRCFAHGTLLHEFMHAIGFHHEQARYDRDDYVEILWDNIRQGKEHNFKMVGPDRTQLLGEEYDFNSIVHYKSRTFSVDGKKPTIRAKKIGTFFGQRFKLSAGDVRKINKLYECDKQTAN